MKFLLLSLTASLSIFCNFQTLAQQTPIHIENNQNYDTDEWRFKNYAFQSETPPIARPITTTFVSKKINGKWVAIDKSKIFGNNAQLVTEKVNAQFLESFNKGKAESPDCFKTLNTLSLNEIEISIDKEKMYFSFILDSSYMSDGLAKCIFPTVSASIPITEIAPLMAP